MKRRNFLRNVGIGTAAAVLHKNTKAAPRPADKPNFIIIMADDMGYGDSSVYDGWIKTPHLEQLAAEGLRFTDFHSSGSVCSPTRAGLVTGRYQERAGIPGVINADPKLPVHHTGLQTSEVTFAKLLKQAGYTCGIFGKWHLGYHKKYNPMHHDFDEFCGFVSGNIDYVSHYDRMGAYDWWHGIEQVEEEGYSTHLITKHSIDFIKRHKNRPFCLYVAHEAVHSPLQGPGDPPVRGPEKVRNKNKAKDTYPRMMKAMDDDIGRLIATVKRLGLADKTFVLFFSDNGASRLGSNAPLRGHKASVWEGGHREPAIAWWPGKIKPGTVTDQLCISLDVMPTMLDLADVRPPKGHKLDGISLAPLMLEGDAPGERQLFWEGKAMRDGDWKLITRTRGFKGPGLFNLAEDIGEKNNIADEHPDRVEAMVAAIEAWKKDVSTGATPQPPPPEDIKKDN